MLYPNFKDLILLEAKANHLGKKFSFKKTNNISGSYLSSFKGQGMEFDKVREYAYGDDVRSIDWRVSARTDQPHIKVFKEEHERNVLLCIDRNDYMDYGTKRTFKNVLAAEVASLLSFAAVQNNDKISFYEFGNIKNRFSYSKPLNSKKSVLHGLKSLCEDKKADQSFSIDGAIFNLRRLHANPNIIFIISDFRRVGETFEKNMFLISKKAQIVFINLVDKSDYEIPDIGKMMINFGTKSFVLNSSNRKGAKIYKNKFARKIEKLENISKKLKAKLINIETSDDFIAKLQAGLIRK